MLLSELKPGQKGIIKNIVSGPLRPRLLEVGVTKGMEVEVLRRAPFADPVEYRIGDFFLGLRRKEADLVEVDDMEAFYEVECFHD